MGLTAKKVATLVKTGVPTRVTDSGDNRVKGLMLCVEGPSSAYWLLRWQRNHQVRHMGLGSVRDRTLAQAREAARAARRQLLDSIDPLEQKRAKRAADAAAKAKHHTFKQASELFHKEHAAGWSGERTGDEFESSLRRWVFPLIGDMDVAAIGKDDILRVLKQEHPKLKGGTFWQQRAVTGEKVRNRVERVLDFAQVHGWRAEGAPNPARWRGFLENVLPAPRRVAPLKNMRALPYAEAPALMAVLAADDTVAAQAVRFVILTACRMGEALGAVWSEINLQTAEWTIPASRMKARREHRVPLSPQVLALLDQLPREEGNPFLFVSAKTVGRPVTDMPVTKALRDAGCDANMHGMRSSFRDWAAERTNFPRELAEQALAHIVGTAVERSYARSDLFEKRRKLMQAWATFATTPPTAKADVVPLRRPG